MKAIRPSVTIADHVDTAMMEIAAQERDFHRWETRKWEIDWQAHGLDGMASSPGWQLLRALTAESKQTVILAGDRALLEVDAFQAGEAIINVAHADLSRDEVDDLYRWVESIYPKSDNTAGRFRIAFWYYGKRGGDHTVRRIDVPKWADTRDNYPATVQRALEPLMQQDFRPASGGQLLLWRGAPGGGKTWGLRALMESWRSWASFHYITDPDQFFGDHADYLMSVLMSDPDGLDGSRESWLRTSSEEEEVSAKRWRVLVLEDTGELLARDAKIRTGQGLSRLLNVVDGLIGQGLKVLVLVTTNEEIGTLHPAVTRPGRCLQDLKFEELSAAEADAWRGRHGLPEQGRKATLANLFAELRGVETVEEPQMGFKRHWEGESNGDGTTLVSEASQEAGH